MKACEGGSSRGCLNLGLVAAGRDDNVRAFALYQKSCNGGWAAGCHHVAASYEQGEGVAKDVIKALAVYTQACDGEYIESCTTAAGLYLAGDVVAKNVEAALRLYGKALEVYAASCKAGYDADCAEADKLRTRLTLIAATQPQQQIRPPMPPAIVQVGRAAQKLIPIAKCTRTSPPSRAATSRLIWNRLATTKPPTPTPVLNADADSV